MNEINRNKAINKMYWREIFKNISLVVKVVLPILILVVGALLFLNLDEPIYTGKDISGVVIERTKSTQGYRQINLVDVVKVRLDNGAIVFYERADLREGDKVLYGVFKGKYSGREVYQLKPSSFIQTINH